ncbi:hypothetical protein [Gracilimonas tropica]|uniref:hypothetical protein n=1 Tax=Gracilimonas tropica TaxID=454600 RepID=UPI00037E11F9|nr:hypothetical protein [Gracilimonas tropica]
MAFERSDAMTSFAIYEIFAFIFAIPLSYGMAYLVKRFSSNNYKTEVDRLVSAVWNGEEEDELNAWLKINLLFRDKKAPQKKKYIRYRIKQLEKHKIKSNAFVNEQGEYRASDELYTTD